MSDNSLVELGLLKPKELISDLRTKTISELGLDENASWEEILASTQREFYRIQKKYLEELKAINPQLAEDATFLLYQQSSFIPEQTKIPERLPAKTAAHRFLNHLETMRESCPANMPAVINERILSGLFGLFTPYAKWQNQINKCDYPIEWSGFVESLEK